MALQNRGLLKLAQSKPSFQEIALPAIEDDHILVKTIAVALNPTDWQTLDEVPRPGFTYSMLGTEAAGIIVEVGKGVTKKFKKGDPVAVLAHGGNDRKPDIGAFAQYIVTKGDIAIHIPPNITFEEAATLPCALGTIALAFYRYLELPPLTFPLPEKSSGSFILIYGGSSATGTVAIQFAKLSGLTVITTASPHNFDLVKSLGADHVFDYHDPECGSKIRDLTSNSLHLVFDTIAVPSSSSICAAALSSNPPPESPSSPSANLYVALLPVEMSRQDVKNIFFLGYSVRGEEFEIEGEVWPAAPEDFELAKKFFVLCERLLEEGKIKNHPVGLRKGGLENVLGGMWEMKEGKYSGEKLVYRVGEIE